MGHISVYCKATKSRQLDRNKDKFNRRESGENRICFICATRGNIASDCRSKIVVAGACTTQVVVVNVVEYVAYRYRVVVVNVVKYAMSWMNHVNV